MGASGALGRLALPSARVLWLALPASALAVLLQRWLATREKDLFGGLDNVVGFSARLIAAARAVETMKGEDALIHDPLASILAGPKAMAKATASRQQQPQQQKVKQQASPSPANQQAAEASQAPGQQQGGEAPGGEAGEGADTKQGQQGRAVSRIVMRTLYFDDAVLLSVGSRRYSDRPVAKALADMQEGMQGAVCMQVVQLGAGMDTRAWRLDLPPGVLWVEVDQGDVLAAKRTIMGRAGAAFEPAAVLPAGTAVAPSAVNGTEPHQQDRGGRPWWSWLLPSSSSSRGSSSGAGPAYPLRAGRYVGVAADLQAPGWAARLVAEAGLDPKAPTCWILEGLLYYLEPETVPVLLQEAASVSAPGSTLVASVWTEAFLESLKARTWKADDIMGAAKWGVPGDRPQWAEYFAAGGGWHVVGSPHWTQAAEDYGLVGAWGRPQRGSGGAGGASSGAAAGPEGKHQKKDQEQKDDQQEKAEKSSDSSGVKGSAAWAAAGDSSAAGGPAAAADGNDGSKGTVDAQKELQELQRKGGYVTAVLLPGRS